MSLEQERWSCKGRLKAEVAKIFSELVRSHGLERRKTPHASVPAFSQSGFNRTTAIACSLLQAEGACSGSS
jgi:hypothetical protein